VAFDQLHQYGKNGGGDGGGDGDGVVTDQTVTPPPRQHPTSPPIFTIYIDTLPTHASAKAPLRAVKMHGDPNHQICVPVSA
jgi:hypothetical protein